MRLFSRKFSTRLPALEKAGLEPGWLPVATRNHRARPIPPCSRPLPIGVILLLFFLLLQFNSYRRVLIVLVTVPLAITGVVPGLLITGNTLLASCPCWG